MYKRIFLDTNPIIYLLEDQKPYSTKVHTFLLQCMNSGAEFYTSTITDSEFMVKPYRTNMLSDIEVYREFLNKLDVAKCFINESIAVQAAVLRAKYDGIKLADALQLAACMETRCDAFLTNDKQLCQVLEVPVIYIGSL